MFRSYFRPITSNTTFSKLLELLLPPLKRHVTRNLVLEQIGQHQNLPCLDAEKKPSILFGIKCCLIKLRSTISDVLWLLLYRWYSNLVTCV